MVKYFLYFLCVLFPLQSYQLVNNDNSFNYKPQRLLSEIITEAKMGRNIRHFLQIGVGTPPQTLKVKLSTAICGIWVLNSNFFGHGFLPSGSGTLQSLDQDSHIDKVRGKIVSDTITISAKVELKDIPFLLVFKTDEGAQQKFDYDGLIGFGYKCKAKRPSNVNLFDKIAKVIENGKQILSYEVNHDLRTGEIVYGKVSNKIDQKSRLFRQLSVNPLNNNGHWEIHLHSVYFDDQIYQVNAPLSIGIGGGLLSVEEVFFDHLLRKKFAPFIVSGVCELVKEDVWEVFCNTDFDENQFEYIAFVVGKWNFKIKGELLFQNVYRKGKNRKWFSVVYFSKYNKWYISQTLFKNSIFIFNKENDTISFYYNN